ncbi:hypothetical protein [Micromonospora sp. NPDC004704]
MLDVAMFRRVCYEAARRAGGKVIEFRISAGVTPNFHQGIIVCQDHTVAVTCVRGAALLAIAVPRDFDSTPARESGPLRFIDMPDLAAALTDAGAGVEGFTVLTAFELDGPIDWARWPGMSSDVRRWNPCSLGEALFTYWD